MTQNVWRKTSPCSYDEGEVDDAADAVDRGGIGGTLSASVSHRMCSVVRGESSKGATSTWVIQTLSTSGCSADAAALSRGVCESSGACRIPSGAHLGEEEVGRTTSDADSVDIDASVVLVRSRTLCAVR